MKCLTRTITVLVVFVLTMGGLALAQNAPEGETFTISGSADLAGVMLKGLPGNPLADFNGKYNVTVFHGWSGTITPEKAGYVFEPASRTYQNVTAPLLNQDYRPRRIGLPSMYGRTSNRRFLVIPHDDIRAEKLAEIMEDLQVMSHILDERFKQSRRVQGMFTDFGDFFGRNNRTTEATYLEGYGVLFSMEVNFTFSSPAESTAREPEEAAEYVDPTWQQARRQVFQPGATQRLGASESTEEQGHRMVEELKKDLIATLKHAANIRALQPDEWIILTVIGTGRGFGGMMMGGMGGMMGGMGGGSSSGGGGGYGGGRSGGYGGGMAMGGGMGGYGGSGFGGSSRDGFGGGMVMGGMKMGGGMGGMGMGGMGTSSVTVLTIRAKKSDVDAFAKGELDSEQFQEKVKTVMY